MVRSFLLWLCTLLGGALAGVGLFVLAQVRIIRYLQQRVDELGFFTRFVGKMTFLWRDVDEKIAFAVEDFPPEYLAHSERIAKILTGVGIAGVAILLPWFLRRRWRRGR